MKVIILAGGKATRLPRAAHTIPKALVEVGGKPVLRHQIDLLAEHGFNDIRLALAAKSQHIIDYSRGRYEYVVEDTSLGTGGAIKHATRDLSDPFFVLNGDVLSNLDFADFAKKYRERGVRNMLVAWYAPDVRDFGSLHTPAFVRQDAAVSQIHGFFEKPKEQRSGFINAGVYILHPDTVANHSGAVFSIEHDIFPGLVSRGDLHAYWHKGWWMEMGTEERLGQAKKHFEELAE